MRAVVQRVTRAAVSIDDEEVGKIGRGLAVFLGIGSDDDEKDIEYLVDRTVNLRVFPDEDGKMNVSTLDAAADVLLVSQFTLYGDCRGGRRPSFVDAAPPDRARSLYETFIERMEEYPLEVATGEFGAFMLVDLENWGPVTLLLDSDKKF